jgi:hypothetical protein
MLHQLAVVFGLAHVSRHKDRVATLGADQRGGGFAGLLVDVGHHHPGAFARPRQGHRAADAGRRAGDQRNLVLQHDETLY